MSKKPYRGVNSFLLSATKYVSPYWLTLKQAIQLCGWVRKGEHGEIVVFWKVDQVAPTMIGIMRKCRYQPKLAGAFSNSIMRLERRTMRVAGSGVRQAAED